MFDTELFVTYKSGVMRWFVSGRSEVSKTVGLMPDEDAVKWAEDLMDKMDCERLSFVIDEEE